VLPGIPHHVTQRGNRRQRTFFEEADYALYLDLLASAAERAGVEIWPYCLMPNHVHIILTPGDPDGLWRTFGDLRRCYTGFINARRRTTRNLWQGRYGSVAMDDAYLMAALRYIALNPVRARLVTRPEEWQWSSTRALLAKASDHVVKAAPALERTGDFAAFLDEDFDDALGDATLDKAESIGRPVGSPEWLTDTEARTGRKLAAQKRRRRGNHAVPL
jgi:putative transposase